ncbi:MAG: putative toxin-antitoxin system toxin component, PIN family [Anaerolineae bacterium]|nr:putative toxin-antitoxin system toxin component, PIN family [Anaerolineae bacterium]
MVFDTNVVVSGFLWSGTPQQILHAVQLGDIQRVASEMLVEELRDVLYRPKFSNRLEKL